MPVHGIRNAESESRQQLPLFRIRKGRNYSIEKSAKSLDMHKQKLSRCGCHRKPSANAHNNVGDLKELKSSIYFNKKIFLYPPVFGC